MRYAIIGEGGIIEQTGSCPDDELHLQGGDQLAVPAPEGVSDMTDYWDGAGFRQLPPKPGTWARFVDGQWIDPRSLSELAHDIGLARLDAAAQINQLRGAVRMRFITSIPGQDLVYQEKERVARAWMGAYLASGVEPDPADFPAVWAEVGPGLTGETAFQVAYIYIEMSEQWRALSPAIERVAIRYLNMAERGTDLTTLEGLPVLFLREVDATLAAILGGAL